MLGAGVVAMPTTNERAPTRAPTTGTRYDERAVLGDWGTSTAQRRKQCQRRDRPRAVRGGLPLRCVAADGSIARRLADADADRAKASAGAKVSVARGAKPRPGVDERGTTSARAEAVARCRETRDKRCAERGERVEPGEARFWTRRWLQQSCAEAVTSVGEIRAVDRCTADKSLAATVPLTPRMPLVRRIASLERGARRWADQPLQSVATRSIDQSGDGLLRALLALALGLRLGLVRLLAFAELVAIERLRTMSETSDQICRTSMAMR